MSKPNWDKVEVATELARGIAFDGCHKIYVALDDEQVKLFGEYGYEYVLTTASLSPKEMLETIKAWYGASCGLRFVSGVKTTEDPNDGFIDLIPQD